MGDIETKLKAIHRNGLWIHPDNTSNLVDHRILNRVMTNSILKDRVNSGCALRSLPISVDDVYLTEQIIVLDVLDKYMDEFDNSDYILLIAGAADRNDVTHVFDTMANEYIGEESISLRDSQVFNKIGYAIQRKYSEILVELMYIEEALLLVRREFT